MQLSLRIISALVLLLTTMCQGTSAQAYHFSKGWAAGKRSSGTSSGTSSSSAAQRLQDAHRAALLELPAAASGGPSAGVQGERVSTYEDGEAGGDMSPVMGREASLDAISSRVGAFLSQRTLPQCAVRPEINAVIELLIQMEADRLESCHNNQYTNRGGDSINFLNWIKTKLNGPSSSQQRK